MTSPRRSTRITGRHHYHGAVRPCAPHQYTAPHGSAAWSLPFHEQPQATTAPLAARGRGTTGSHVPHQSPDQARATSMPDTAWPVGRLPPGSSRTIRSNPVLMSSKGLSTRHQWIACARLLGLHLPRSTARLFRRRSPPRLLTAAACGGLRPPPAGRPRRTPDPKDRALHLRYSTASISPIFYIDLLVAFVAHSGPSRSGSSRRQSRSPGISCTATPKPISPSDDASRRGTARRRPSATPTCSSLCAAN